VRQNLAADYGGLTLKDQRLHGACTLVGAPGVLRHLHSLSELGTPGAAACHAQLEAWSASTASVQKKKTLVCDHATCAASRAPTCTHALQHGCAHEHACVHVLTDGRAACVRAPGGRPLQDDAGNVVQLHGACRTAVRDAADRADKQAKQARRGAAGGARTPATSRKHSRQSAGSPERVIKSRSSSSGRPKNEECLLCDGAVSPLHVSNQAHVPWEKRACTFDKLSTWPRGKGKGTVCSDAALRIHEAVRKRQTGDVPAGKDLDPAWTAHAADVLRQEHNLDGVPDLLAYPGQAVRVYHVRCLVRFEHGRGAGREVGPRRNRATNFNACGQAALRHALELFFAADTPFIFVSEFEEWMGQGVAVFNAECPAEPGKAHGSVYQQDTWLRKVRSAFADEIHVDVKGMVMIKLATVAAAVVAGRADQTSSEQQLCDRFVNVLTNETNRMPCTTRSVHPDFVPDVDAQLAEVPPLLVRLLAGCLHRRSVLELGREQKLVVAHHGQCMRQKATPRTRGYLAPMVHVKSAVDNARHHSRHQTETDNKLGLGHNPKHVRLFLRTLALHADDLLSMPASYDQGGRAKGVFDNADKDTSSRDGRQAIHHMAGMLTLSNAPGSSTNMISYSLPRGNISAKQVEAAASTANLERTFPGRPVHGPEVKYRTYAGGTGAGGNAYMADLLACGAGRWGATGESIAQLQFYRRAHAAGKVRLPDVVVALPFININPGGKDGISAVWSAMKLGAPKILALGMPVAMTAYDLPLCLKSLHCVAYARQPNPARPGGVNDQDVAKCFPQLGLFHLVMSLLGCVGYMIKDTGLPVALETTFGKGAVVSILDGKNYNRAIRAHDNLSSVLTEMLMEDASEAADVPATAKLTPTEKATVGRLYHQLLQNPAAGRTAATTGPTAAAVTSARRKVKAVRAAVAARGRNARLCVTYVQVVECIQTILRGCRSKDFDAVHDALRSPECHAVLAACGALHYTKGLQLYLQSLDELKRDHPGRHAFVTENFCVQLSAGAYNAVGDDRSIEMCIMKWLKQLGCFSTPVSLQTEGYVATELMSKAPMSQLASMWDELLGGVARTWSFQHDGDGAGDSTDSGTYNLQAALHAHDRSDRALIRGWFCDAGADRNPFKARPHLVNLHTGQHAGPGVNIDDCLAVGSRVVARMNGLQVQGP